MQGLMDRADWRLVELGNSIKSRLAAVPLESPFDPEWPRRFDRVALTVCQRIVRSIAEATEKGYIPTYATTISYCMFFLDDEEF